MTGKITTPILENVLMLLLLIYNLYESYTACGICLRWWSVWKTVKLVFWIFFGAEKRCLISYWRIDSLKLSHVKMDGWKIDKVLTSQNTVNMTVDIWWSRVFKNNISLTRGLGSMNWGALTGRSSSGLSHFQLMWQPCLSWSNTDQLVYGGGNGSPRTDGCLTSLCQLWTSLVQSPKAHDLEMPRLLGGA